MRLLSSRAQPVRSYFLAGRSDVAAAFSLRRLSKTYAGALVRLRRASDNAEADFGGAGFVSVPSIQSWLSGSSAFISKWYDQSGNGRDLTQATTSAQPAFNGALSNGQPGLVLDGTASYMQTGAFTLTPAVSFNVLRRTVTAGSTKIIFGQTTSAAVPYYADRSAFYENVLSNGNEAPHSDLGTSMPAGTRGVVGGTFGNPSSASLLNVNAATIAAFTGDDGGTTAWSGLTLGNRGTLGSTNYYAGEIQEFVFFSTGHTALQLAADNAVMRAAWHF